MRYIAPEKPALDEVHDFTTRRVFSGHRLTGPWDWFEIHPGRFWLGTDWADAGRFEHDHPKSGVSLLSLRDTLPDLTDVTDQYR